MTVFRTADAFGRALKKWIKEDVPNEVTKKQMMIMGMAIEKIVNRTPRDSGAGASNWRISINNIPSNELTRIISNEAIIAKGIKQLTKLEFGDEAFITNNKQHVLILELGGFVPANPGPSKDSRPERKGQILVEDGYSVQAPQGMVSITYDELLEEIKKLL